MRVICDHTAIMTEAKVMILTLATLLLSSSICHANGHIPSANGETMFVSKTVTLRRNMTDVHCNSRKSTTVQ